MEVEFINEKPVFCPSCKSVRVADIYYGKPKFPNETLKKALDTKRTILGGCFISDFSPDWMCVDCNSQFKDRNKPKISSMY